MKNKEQEINDISEKAYYSNGYQPLFNIMADNGLVLTESEMFEIIECVRLMDKYQTTQNPN